MTRSVRIGVIALLALLSVGRTGIAQETAEPTRLETLAGELADVELRIDDLQARYEAANEADKELYFVQLRHSETEGAHSVHPSAIIFAWCCW